MVTETSIIADLAAIAGPEHVYEPPAEQPGRHEVDGLAPRAIVEPASYEEVAAILRYADERRLAVIPRDGVLPGNVPARYDIALSLRRMSQLIEHEPADMTVTCQAGMMLSELQVALDAKGQMIPALPSTSDPSVEGLLAANGPCDGRHAYGTPRDYTIGMRVVTAEGRITRAGGKVVKNVAGYDLCKLYTGSFRTLGVIVEATFKTIPLPRARRRIVLEFPSPARACAFASEMARRGLALEDVVLNRHGAPTSSGPEAVVQTILQLHLAGALAAVDRSQREIEQTAAQEGAKRLDDRDLDAAWDNVASDAGRTLECKLAIPPSKLPDLIQSLDRECAYATIQAQPTCGTLVAAWAGGGSDGDLLSRVRGTVARAGGTLVVQHCSPELKREIDVFDEIPAPSFALMRNIKAQFDPNGVLSPGRFVGRL